LFFYIFISILLHLWNIGYNYLQCKGKYTGAAVDIKCWWHALKEKKDTLWRLN